MPLAMRKASSRSFALSTARTGPKISSWATRAEGWTSATIIGPTIVPLVGERASIALEDHAAFGGGDPLVFEDALACVGVDHRANFGLGIVGRPDLDRSGRLDQSG